MWVCACEGNDQKEKETTQNLAIVEPNERREKR